MPELQRLHADHAAAVLAFERTNRAYFAASVSDRGEAYFDQFDERFESLLVDQQTGAGAYHVLVDADGSILGRFNLIKDGDGVEDGTAELGYRMAEHAAGRGLATAAVGELCRLASTQYGLRLIRAATTPQNTASQRVLTNNGFRRTGSADPAELGGKSGDRYERVLSDEPRSEEAAQAQNLHG